jgi:hypothetical protein
MAPVLRGRVDSGPSRSYHPRMPMWRCPHCGTPQAETARCWVCHRSSTACLTCRHYRRSVAAKIGFCGLDAHRLPLIGDEIRPCWEAGSMPSSLSITAATPPDPTVAAGSAEWRPATATSSLAVSPPKRTFVEVGTGSQPPSSARADTPAEIAVPVPDAPAPRWSLWED